MKAYLVVMLVLFAVALVSDPDKPTSENVKRWGKAIQLMLLVWTAILLGGCASPERPATNPDVETYDIPQGGVYEFRLRDGTRCAVYAGYKAGGIDCEWRRPGSPVAVSVE